MKKAISVILTIFMMFTISGCGNSVNSVNSADSSSSKESAVSEEKTQTTSQEPSNPESSSENDIPQTPKSSALVVYFSCTGRTKAAAEKIAKLCGADIYEIVPAEPYTSDDLNYNSDDCRANREMNDESARPAIAGELPDISGYNAVFIGYPIWWGTMPRIINTFLDACDLSGKTVMPFCTSGGSGISTSVSAIKEAEPQADVRGGLRINGTDDDEISAWAQGL